MGIANCIKCNKIFQRGASPLCSDCMDATKDQASHVIDFVMEHRGLTLEEVAHRYGLPQKEIEELLFSGCLGMAGAYIMFKCQSCHKRISAKLRKGRFCPDCAGQIEAVTSQAGEAAATHKEPVKAKPPKLVCEVHKDESAKPAAESNGTNAADAKSTADSKTVVASPDVAQTVRPESPPKPESVSPVLDSYGFKRVSEL